MKIRILLISILLSFLLGCDKKRSNDFKEKHGYPAGFIDPHTNVNIQIDEKTNKILESLTNYNLSNQFKSCYDSNANHCEGMITKKVQMFFNFTNQKKEISFLTNYNRNCSCNPYFTLNSTLESIPFDKISRIDTISIEEDAYGEKLISIMIYPKYNNDDVQYKRLHLIYDSVSETYGYSKDYGANNDPIIIHARKNSAVNLKNYFEELIDLNTP